PNFLTASNLLIMTQHVAITGLLAIGMTLVILTGGIDLSVGAVITRFGVAPFICTLGMMYVARGSALLFNDGSTYPNLNGME
ncbi:ABC transporter permease, partial [Klebsiella pneumoniae]|nr:ABC transporter permease [Klebsiella pneumoniae]